MNKCLSGLSCVVGASMMLLGMSLSAHAETDDEYLLRMQQIVTQGETGVGLFPIQVAGETFAGERSQIGHRVSDFTLNGNGIAGFKLVRKFQDSPAVAPYAFGNMSIELPTLSFRLKLNERSGTPSDAAYNMSCSHFSAQGISAENWTDNPDRAVSELYDDVQFGSPGGGTSLLPRALVNTNYLANYPSDALLVSKDNYYLRCDGAHYVLYAPDGTSYHFDAAVSADKIVSSTTTTNAQNDTSVTPFRSYRIRANAIKRHNSTINFSYEALPTVTVSRSGNNYTEDRDARARTPLAPTRYNNIESANRLTSIQLVAAHDTNPNLPEFHTLNIEYHPNSGTNCPGLVNNIRQTYQADPTAGIALVHQKRYGYRVLNFTEQGLVAAPRSGCLLSTVEHADERDNGQFVELWNFTYGTYSGASDGLIVTGRGDYHTVPRGAWDTSLVFGHTYIPLREVITPTSSKVVYEYSPLKPCHYQRQRRRDTDGSCKSSNTNVNAVSKRTVHYQSEGQAKSHETTFETVRHNGNEYQTWIKNSDHWHRLVFARGFTTEYKHPESSVSLNDSAQEWFLKSGRLLKHEFRLPSGTILIDSAFEYKENGVFPASHASRVWRDYPEEGDTWLGDQGWGWKNARRGYLQNHRRVNRYKTSTTIDGNTYVREVKFKAGFPDGYDAYNKPVSVAESYTLSSGTTGTRAISYNYDHDYASKFGWYVGLLSETRRHSGSDAYVDAKTYNASGLVSSQTVGGITTQYQYHLNGNLKALINGNNHATNYSNYKHGVATTIASPENGLTTRVVDVRGNITSETVRKEGSTYQTTGYVYDDAFSRVSQINHPGGVDPTTITYPNWRAGYGQWIKRETRGRLQVITQLDSLGRVDYAGPFDTESSQWRYVNTVYDALGRVIKTSDPSTSPTSQIGMEYQYDDFGRVVSSRHTHDPSSTGSMLYCYGSECASGSNNGNFSGAGAVKDGYAVRDQKGAVTVYNYRAYGSPKNAELIEIRQEIQPANGYREDDQVLVTTLERNQVGFITKISQGSGDEPSDEPIKWFSREYEPHKINGDLTSLIKSETHPEFDTKTVISFDGVGNPTSVMNYDGSIHNYTYDNKERLVFHTTPASTSEIETAGTIGYSYYANGSLKSITSSGSVWTYDYNANNLLTQADLSFAGESFTLGYDYDDELNLSQITYPSGEVISYTSNGFGEQETAGDFVSGAAYHPNGYLKSMTLGSGETYSTSLNNRKRVNQISVNLPGAHVDAQDPLSIDYSYTDRGNVASITHYFNNSLDQSTSLTNLQYDGLSRLHQATGDWGTGNSAANFSYDPWGNIDKRYVGGVDLDYSYNASTNRLTSASFSAGAGFNRVFQYDGNGNVIDDGIKSFTYDHLNRLVNADTDGTTVQANTYDGHGHRVRMIVNDGRRVRTTFFVYDPSGTLLHEFDKESGEQRDHIQFNGRTIATKSRHQNYDSDSDGIPDYFERTFGLPVFNAANATQDTDSDGLTDLEEFQLGQIPTSNDSDGDGTPDGAEFPPVLIAPNPISLEPIFDYLLLH